MEKIHWGKYNKKNAPIVHYDPLQSFFSGNTKTGFRVFITPSRDNRPREFARASKNKARKSATSEHPPKDSVLIKIINGEEPCIPISADNKGFGNGSEDEITKNFTKYEGICIVNKFSPLGYVVGESYGIAVLSYPTKYIETLDDEIFNCQMLIPLKTAIKHLLVNPKLNSSLVFINNGRQSGASLTQLHIQAYLLDQNKGMISYAFRKSFESTKECLTCKIANNEDVVDHLDQHLLVQQRTVWEDEFMRILVPFAPIRPFAMRIIPKKHHSSFHLLSNEELKSMGTALKLSHQIILFATPPHWPILKDRTVAFRQTEKFGQDFHFFIDMLTTIPLGGAEVIDYLSISSINPIEIAKEMKSIIHQITNN